ncbi:hypothetical protein FRACA_1360003 [Frankia canadensis]|uniref:Uncharacterized protein n=1 Tax=Frankia canadensis TaxID=1836972 RepID=A0A2I2KKZ2_9ACTN|nr:hypothetical protein FRACA_1360003 [Frankia canadensis]SOU53615.1 hypothetical protein FRACA_1360003 [Frankia canadensis]
MDGGPAARASSGTHWCTPPDIGANPTAGYRRGRPSMVTGQRYRLSLADLPAARRSGYSAIPGPPAVAAASVIRLWRLNVAESASISGNRT